MNSPINSQRPAGLQAGGLPALMDRCGWPPESERTRHHLGFESNTAATTTAGAEIKDFSTGC
ncbi:hypothetical protein [Arthrobacter sp. AG1021]|uniref:hypothetical protein n=1 Tax=Arthrobacter sp. AG1021 TaxID=2183908 RepID=UPI0011C490B1|nr:hypothetical protein [Arthrobacter sp. AG1021]